MAREGANLPHQADRSHDHAAAPHGSTPAFDGLGIVRSSSNSSSVSKLAGEISNAGAGSKPASSLAVLHAGDGEDNTTESKNAGPAVLDAGKGSNAGSELASPAMLHPGELNNTESKMIAIPAAMLHAGELEDTIDGSKQLASPVVLHAGEDNETRYELAIQTAPHADEGINTSRSMLTCPVVLFAREGDDAGSKMDGPTKLHVSMDSNADAGFIKVDSPPALLYAGENDDDGDSGSKLASQPALHAGEDKDINAGKDDKAGSKLAIQAVPDAGEDSNARSKLSTPVLPRAGEGNDDIASKLAVQAVIVHADEGNTAVSKQVVQAAAIHAGEDDDTVSKLAIQAAPHVEEDSNSKSKLATPPGHHAGEGDNAASKLAIQSVPHADEDNNSMSVLARVEVLDAGDDDNTAASKLAIQAQPPHAGEDKLADPAAAGNGDSTTKDEGESDVAGGEGGESVAATGSSGGALSKTSNKSTSDGGGSDDDAVKDAPAAVADDGVTGGCKGKGKGVAATKKDQALHIWTEKERRKKMKNMFSTLHALLPQLPEKADKATIVGEAVTYIKSLEGTVERLEKQKQERMRAQQAAAGAGSSSGAAASSALPPAPAPAQAAAATRESVLADMVQSWNAQEALMAELKAAATAVVYGAGTASDGAVPAPAPPLPPAPPRLPPIQTWSSPNIVVCVAGDNAFINLCTPQHPGLLTRLFYVLERHRIHVVAATVSSSPTQKMFFIQARINTAAPPPPMLPENMTVEERYKLAVAEMLHAVGY